MIKRFSRETVCQPIQTYKYVIYQQLKKHISKFQMPIKTKKLKISLNIN